MHFLAFMIHLFSLTLHFDFILELIHKLQFQTKNSMHDVIYKGIKLVLLRNSLEDCLIYKYFILFWVEERTCDWMQGHIADMWLSTKCSQIFGLVIWGHVLGTFPTKFGSARIFWSVITMWKWCFWTYPSMIK